MLDERKNIIILTNLIALSFLNTKKYVSSRLKVSNCTFYEKISTFFKRGNCDPTGNCKTSVWHVYYKENVKFSSNEGSQFVLNPLYDIDVNLESLKKISKGNMKIVKELQFM